MPKGPQGQKRPADVISAAVLVAKIGGVKGEVARLKGEQNALHEALLAGDCL